MNFDAVNIEHAFAKLIGNPVGARGTSHDADVFREGNPKSLAVAIDEAVDSIEERIKAINFTDDDRKPGQARARIDVAINRLRNISQAMTKLSGDNHQGYQWEIIGCLVSIIDVLIEKARH